MRGTRGGGALRSAAVSASTALHTRGKIRFAVCASRLCSHLFRLRYIPHSGEVGLGEHGARLSGQRLDARVLVAAHHRRHGAGERERRAAAAASGCGCAFALELHTTDMGGFMGGDRLPCKAAWGGKDHVPDAAPSRGFGDTPATFLARPRDRSRPAPLGEDAARAAARTAQTVIWHLDLLRSGICLRSGALFSLFEL